MNKKIAALAFVPVLGLGLLGAQSASAHGWFGGFGNATPEEIAAKHQTMFDHQAKIFGLSVEEIKQAWADGKNIFDLAKEKGLTEEQLHARIKEGKTAELKTQLQSLVDKGIITQLQADKRLQLMTTSMETKHGKIMKGFHRGFGF